MPQRKGSAATAAKTAATIPGAGVRRPAAALSSPLNCVELADEPEEKAVEEREPDEEAEPELDAVWPKLDVVDGKVFLQFKYQHTHPTLAEREKYVHRDTRRHAARDAAGSRSLRGRGGRGRGGDGEAR